MKLVLALSLLLALSTQGSAFFKFKRYKTREIGVVKDLESSESYCEERWFKQPLDHFSPTDSRTWKQRYFVNDKYYEEGGPIFLMVNGEQDTHPEWLGENVSLEMYLAKRYRAKVFFLEHRYYGMSRPTPDLSMENIAHLGAEQALMDTAYFIKGMNRIHKTSRTTKWILFGCSYAGTLVVWMRSKYPHLVHGAVANSAPLLAEVDFKEFFMVVERALRKHSLQCYSTLKDAFNEINRMLADKSNYRKLEQLFGVCGEHFEEENTDVNDIVNFYEGVLDIATEVVFNNDSYNLTIEKACEVLESDYYGNRPVERLAEVNKLLLKENNQDCMPLAKYNETIKSLKNIVWNNDDAWDRRWIYQTCTEFGWYQTTTARPFKIPSDAIPVDMYKQLCSDVFGSRRMLEIGVARTNLLYGGLEIAETTSNIVFVHGGNDPWHAAGVIGSVNPKSPVIYVEGGGHCPLIYPPRKDESPNVTKAQYELQHIIDTWLQVE